MTDILEPGLDIVFVGCNPVCLQSVICGHYYQGSTGKDFLRFRERYSLLLEPAPGTFHDEIALQHGLGFSDVNKRPGGKCGDLGRDEIRMGRPEALEKLRRFWPKVISSPYKEALALLLGMNKRALRNRWGFFQEVREQAQNLIGCDAFILPFSARKNKEVEGAAERMRDLQTVLSNR